MIWKGAARRATEADFINAALRLNCEVATVKAVWQVESSGRPFLSDGSLTRRFEAHKMPGTGITSWKTKISAAKRDRMLADNYRRNPDAALRATSWGGPQIMGFNAQQAGYPTADAMVRAMADSEAAQLVAFVDLCKAWGLQSAFRARDWKAIARKYNGSGQVATYAAKMESAYRALAGQPSPVVLRAGSSDATAVRRLQSALGIEADGSFGPETEAAVRAFQTVHGLGVDGVVGAKTWAALERTRDAVPPVQHDSTDRLTMVSGYAGATTAVGGAVATLGDALPDTAVTIIASGATVAGVMALGAFLFLKIRKG